MSYLRRPEGPLLFLHGHAEPAYGRQASFNIFLEAVLFYRDPEGSAMWRTEVQGDIFYTKIC